MASAESQISVNRQAWAAGGHVAGYANRRLIAVEVMLLVRYREALSGRVLEAGCGAGRVLGYLVALGGEVHGFDISADMVDHCRAAYPTAEVRVGDLSEIRSAAEGTFTAVLAIDNVLDVFDHGGRRRVLSEIRELLDPDGILVFSSHNLDYADGSGAGSGPSGADRGRRARELVRKAASRPASDVARAVAGIPRSLANRRRLAPLQHRDGDHAIINDEAHDYGLLHYYITREAQARQLAELGYELLDCLDAEGDSVGSGARSPSPWLHYVARPAGGPGEPLN